MKEIFTSWAFQNCLVFLLLAGLGAFVYLCSKREYWRVAFREIRRKRGAVVCFWIITLYVLVAVLDSVGWRCAARDAKTGEILHHPETGQVVYTPGKSALDYMLSSLAEHREKTYSSPMAETLQEGDGSHAEPLAYPKTHLLGTDRVGSDVLYLSIKSIRTGLIIGVLTTLLAIPLAMLCGVVSGYFGGWVDDVLQYICVVISSIPSILFIAAFMLIFGQGLTQLCIAMGIASWTGLYRLLRAETLRLREMEYIQAANALGVPVWRILTRHIVPNLLHLVLITAVLRFSSEVLAEASLTYLGIGVGADTYSWGTMINDARTELTRDPIVWWKLCAAFTFMLGLVLPANILGDAVRDALDPRLRSE